MNEEIKEMLWKIKRQNTYDDIGYFKTPLSNDDADKLLNYITNLQKENEELKETLQTDKLMKAFMVEHNRNEKAIEYIENAKMKDGRYDSRKLPVKPLLNILEGGDE